MFSQLFVNFCMMVALVYALSLTMRRTPNAHNRRGLVAVVLLASLVPLLLVIYTAEVRPGVKFDLRHVPVALVTLWTGPLAGALAAVPFVSYRLINFGPGTIPAIVSMALLITTASLLRRRLDSGLERRPTLRDLPFVLLLFSLNGVSPAFLLPDGMAVVRATYLPLMALNVLGFYLAANILHDRARLVASLGEARQQAAVDPLTGLANRRQFDRDLGLVRTGDVVLMIDIDHFKNVNDTLGHATGDRVLVDLARLLRENFRGNDTVYRYGGEEFAAIVRDIPPQAVPGLTARLCERVRQAPWPQLSGRTLSVSVGAARHQGEAEGNAQDVLGRADAALYRAKAEGRDRAVLVSGDFFGPQRAAGA